MESGGPAGFPTHFVLGRDVGRWLGGQPVDQ
jgi:hypothetical protein